PSPSVVWTTCRAAGGTVGTNSGAAPAGARPAIDSVAASATARTAGKNRVMKANLQLLILLRYARNVPAQGLFRLFQDYLGFGLFAIWPGRLLAQCVNAAGSGLPDRPALGLPIRAPRGNVTPVGHSV